MRKTLTAVLICAAVSGMLLSGTMPGHATGMSVGVNTWYTTWDMSPSDGSEYDPALMYGPVIGLDLSKRWSLTSVFLTGNFKSPQAAGMTSDEINYRRYDSDTTLNYSINRWLKVFGGFKYIRYDVKMSSNLDAIGEVLLPFEGGDFRHYSYGPGAGIGITLPLSNSLFVLGNFSLMYLFGNEAIPAIMKAWGRSPRQFVDMGFNTTLSLAYYLESYTTTVSAGVRYQYFKEKYENSDVWGRLKFFGVTVAAIYHFSLGDKE